MKKYTKALLVSAILLGTYSCSDDFINNEPYTEKVKENFYSTPKDGYQGLVAVYDALQREGYGGFLLTSEIASDNCFGGFGTADDQVTLDWDRFKNNADREMNAPVWKTCYQGIFRANVLLENLDNIDWGTDTDLKTQYEAEARFLRAHFHFELARMFGDVVALDHTITADEFETPRSSAEDTYALIANDFKFAADNLGNDNYSTPGNVKYGRITKWAAEAYLAKAFLFYTSYYNKTDLVGVVSKTEVITYINDVVDNSGHDLIPEFKNLWLAASLDEYAGEGNTEIVWAIRFNSSGNGDWNLHEGNRFQVNIAPRGSNIGNYASGWGGATVNPDLYNAYQIGDTRRDATIIDYATEGLNFDAQERGQRQFTGYSWKKYCPITNDAGDGVVADGGGDFQIDNYEDYVVIRFADVLLMAAELNLGTDDVVAQADLDRVRERAFGNNTNNVAVTMASIMNERRLELALEGQRYFDLIRQGVDVAKAAIDNSGEGAEFDVTFRTATKGWFALPQSQVLLSNGTISQNTGW